MSANPSSGVNRSQRKLRHQLKGLSRESLAGILVEGVVDQCNSVSGLSDGADTLLSIVNFCQGSDVHKLSLRALARGCCSVMQALAMTLRLGDPTQASQQCADNIQAVLREILEKLSSCSEPNVARRYLASYLYEEKISQCEEILTMCRDLLKTQLHVAVHLDLWRMRIIDKQKVISFLGEIQNRDSILAETAQAVEADLQGMLKSMQNSLRISNQFTSQGLRENISAILQQKEERLLPEMSLMEDHEVHDIAEFSFGDIHGMNTWNARYMNTWPVCLKQVGRATDERMRDRLRREAETWRKVWEEDKGRKIMPYYGFCEGMPDDRLQGHPYVVVPDAPMDINDWLYEHKQYNPDRRVPIRKVADAILFLHGMSPAIVHGGIRGRRIRMRGDEPMLADFGLSKFVQPGGFTIQTRSGYDDDERWTSPECQGYSGQERILHPPCDVYSFAMTILEIMSSTRPFAELRGAGDLTEAIRRHEHPRRTPSLVDEWKSRGLDDNLWDLLVRCWNGRPELRPTMEEVKQCLP